MPKESKPKKPVHQCDGPDHGAGTWTTACGDVLDRGARAETVLAFEWELVTCKACLKHAPDDE